jgi:hypothetical protein
MSVTVPGRDWNASLNVKPECFDNEPTDKSNLLPRSQNEQLDQIHSLLYNVSSFIYLRFYRFILAPSLYPFSVVCRLCNSLLLRLDCDTVRK